MVGLSLSGPRNRGVSPVDAASQSQSRRPSSSHCLGCHQQRLARRRSDLPSRMPRTHITCATTSPRVYLILDRSTLLRCCRTCRTSSARCPYVFSPQMFHHVGRKTLHRRQRLSATLPRSGSVRSASMTCSTVTRLHTRGQSIIARKSSGADDVHASVLLQLRAGQVPLLQRTLPQRLMTTLLLRLRLIPLITLL